MSFVTPQILISLKHHSLLWTLLSRHPFLQIIQELP
nr:MAG TPA: hypothetical protein [Crassvirales sp.]